jgi:hypothetical protein
MMTEAYHWTPPVQRLFVAALAETGSVAQACQIAGKSRRAAYDLRMRQEGAAFRIGWDAAVLVARARLVDDLMERAIEGQEEVIIRDPDSNMVTRKRHDNRLALSLLSRLDRMADADPASGSDFAAARIVAQDFGAFLALIEQGETGDGAAAFIAARTPVAHPRLQCEVTADAARLAAANDDEQSAGDAGQVWYDAQADEWMTNFPPPAGWFGTENGRFGDPHYARDLSSSEAVVQNQLAAAAIAPLRIAAEAARMRYFGEEA